MYIAQNKISPTSYNFIIEKKLTTHWSFFRIFSIKVRNILYSLHQLLKILQNLMNEWR